MNKDEKYVVSEYTKKEKSTHKIAEEMGTYPNKIRRILIKNGVILRDKSSAQSIAIDSGRHSHPTKGRRRTEDERIKISEGMSFHWEIMGEDERERRSEIARKQWMAMTEVEKKNLLSMAAEGMRRAGREGSKLEKFLLSGLTSGGHRVIFHRKGLIPNQKLEVDIFLPELKTAIEVDGPSHFFPIWGEEKLQKQIKSDAHKSGLLLGSGFIINRIKNISKNVSQKLQKDLLKKVEDLLAEIGRKFPSKGKRFIEISI